MYYARVRSGRAFASAAVFTALAACVACTYDVPGLLFKRDDAGGHIHDGDPVSRDGGAPATDTDSSTDGASQPENGIDGSVGGGLDAACTDLLCACNNSSDCASRVCAQELMVGRSFYSASGGTSFCTRPCCSSADCSPESVCFAGGQGGNYCVNPAWLGRSAPGMRAGGAACTTDGECRSGLCSNGACADTCCSAVDVGRCAQGAACTFGDFPGRVPFDDHFTGRCAAQSAAPGRAAGGASCRDDDDCNSALCVDNRCSDPCHSATDCPAGTACLLDEQGIDLYAACLPSKGSQAQGSTCTAGANATCAGAWCNPHGRCTGVCFTDDDCISDWRCAPRIDSLPMGNYLVLGCGP
jgi:hypothetical protein